MPEERPPMSEESRKFEKELRDAFRQLYPLTEERDLPWAPCHIDGFLRERLRREVEQRVRHFEHRVVRVLSEVSPPKHIDDMARHAVEAAKTGERLKHSHDEQRAALREIAAMLFGQPDRATPAEIAAAVKHRLQPEPTAGI